MHTKPGDSASNLREGQQKRGFRQVRRPGGDGRDRDEEDGDDAEKWFGRDTLRQVEAQFFLVVCPCWLGLALSADRKGKVPSGRRWLLGMSVGTWREKQRRLADT